MTTNQQFRKPNLLENQLVNKLLSAEFVGRKEINDQVKSFRVRRVDEEGSFEIEPWHSAVAAMVEKRIPVEAEGLDEDGVCIHLLLHVVNGYVKELEIYKDDSSPIKRMPPADDFALVIPK